jgi:signal peptidase I
MNEQIPEDKKPEVAELPDGPFPSWLEAAGRFLVETVEIVVISLAIILPIRYFLIQPFYVKGASMEPTFDDHEYLIIDEISYRFEAPARGDVVVFRYPLDPKQYFIKRVIGLPGETVTVKDSQVTIDPAGEAEPFVLDEGGYLAPGTVTSGERTVVLGDGDYFVLGDNRRSSLDSRTFGALPRPFIVGRVWIRGWPFDRAEVFGRDESPYAAPANP